MSFIGYQPQEIVVGNQTSFKIQLKEDTELLGKLRDKDCIKNYRETLQAILEEVQEQMKGFADQFFGRLDTNGVKVEDLKNGSRGIASYFNKLQSGKLDVYKRQL